LRRSCIRKSPFELCIRDRYLWSGGCKRMILPTYQAEVMSLLSPRTTPSLSTPRTPFPAILAASSLSGASTDHDMSGDFRLCRQSQSLTVPSAKPPRMMLPETGSVMSVVSDDVESVLRTCCQLIVHAADRRSAHSATTFRGAVPNVDNITRSANAEIT